MVVTDAAKPFIRNVNVQDAAGNRVPQYTYTDRSYGLMVSLTSPLYVDSMRPGQSLSLEVAIDSTAAPDLNRFPCPKSTYAADDNACDIFLHGLQTAKNTPRVLFTNGGLEVPPCCPEGVVRYSKPRPSLYPVTMANAAYSLAYDSSTVNGGQTSLSFSLQYHGGSSGPCSQMSVDAIDIFFSAALQADVIAITLNGMDLSFSVRRLMALPYIHVPLSTYTSVLNSTLTVKLAQSFSMADFCSTPYQAVSV
ncbi:DUF3707 domain-containing protein [Haematococcus lacustris]|uniref:DUF3707 domain-containing protein n=1 Tax=Haematococcus lacustris TaxID=44745 RepID=A0A6A0A408_HAELA|nr:DUF3707 domain-containing protein [Haematococcus lacustris]